MVASSPEAPAPAWRQTLLGLLVSAVALGLLLALSDLDQVAASFRRARPTLLLAAVPLIATSFLTRARAWQLLLPAPVPLGAVFSALSQGYLVNTVLPLRLGDPARALLLARDSGLPALRVLPSVVVERYLDLVFILTLLLASGAALGVAAVGSLPTTALWVALVPIQLAAAALVLMLVARHRERLTAALGRAEGPWHAARRLLGDALAGLAVLERPSRFAHASAWLGVTWLQAVAVYWLCLRAFVPAPGVVPVAFGLAVSAFGIALPSSPAGIGVVEAAWTGALTLAGVDQAAAFAFAVSSHALTAAATVLLGGWAMARRGATPASLHRQLRDALPTLRRSG
jgi:glycosyltransferase 2 family protein